MLKVQENARVGEKCGTCDRWIHYKFEEITRKEVEYPVWIGRKLKIK